MSTFALSKGKNNFQTDSALWLIDTKPQRKNDHEFIEWYELFKKPQILRIKRIINLKGRLKEAT